MSTMQTLAKTFAEIELQIPGSPWVPLGNFMMDFFRNHPALQAALLADPLQPHKQETHQWAVFCAASAEYLANSYHLACPAWAHDPAYQRLCDPWYLLPMASTHERVRQRLLTTTPEAFAARNIYCGDKLYVDKYAEAKNFLAQRHSA